MWGAAAGAAVWGAAAGVLRCGQWGAAAAACWVLKIEDGRNGD